MNHVSAEAPTTELIKTMVILVLTKSKLLIKSHHVHNWNLGSEFDFAVFVKIHHDASDFS